MKIVKYFFLILLYNMPVLMMDFNANEQENTTHLKPPLERMLSRKKRFLLLPKGAHLKFTVQLSKRLLAAFPRGFNFVMETALYYPTPSARIDLIPKRLRKPTTTTPKPIGPKPQIFVCIPGSLICYKGKPAAKPMKVQRIDENVTASQWIERNEQNYNGNFQKYQNYEEKYSQPGQKLQWTKYRQPEQYEKYQWIQPTNKPLWTQWTSPSTKWYKHLNLWKDKKMNYSKWSEPRLQQYQEQHRQLRWRRALTRIDHYIPSSKIERNLDRNNDDVLHSYEPVEFPELEPFYNWKHYHSHRDRRQLFYQFEGVSQILGINMKSCILRAICESKRYLLPAGYSMIQDILRLVFTLPTTDGLSDEYSKAMQSDFDTCDKFLKPKCAFSILNWFLNSNYK